MGSKRITSLLLLFCVFTSCVSSYRYNDVRRLFQDRFERDDDYLNDEGDDDDYALRENDYDDDDTLMETREAKADPFFGSRTTGGCINRKTTQCSLDIIKRAWIDKECNLFLRHDCCKSCADYKASLGIVDGGWSKWVTKSSCTKSCGGGQKTEMRYCTNPEPRNGGKHCYNYSQRLVSCNTMRCSIFHYKKDGGWSNWSNWSKCTKSCGGGEKVQTRYCNNPAPRYGGKRCPNTGTRSLSCNTQRCRQTGKPKSLKVLGKTKENLDIVLKGVDKESCLKSNNYLRNFHKDTGGLVWDNELEKTAQEYADKLAINNLWKHSSAANSGRYGENLYRGTVPTPTQGSCLLANYKWYDEIKHWKWDKPEYNIMATWKKARATGEYGHFTQLVWKNTKKMGAGRTVVKLSNGNYKSYVVVHYSPPGNHQLQKKDQVMKLKHEYMANYEKYKTPYKPGELSRLAKKFNLL